MPDTKNIRQSGLRVTLSRCRRTHNASTFLLPGSGEADEVGGKHLPEVRHDRGIDQREGEVLRTGVLLVPRVRKWRSGAVPTAWKWSPCRDADAPLTLTGSYHPEVVPVPSRRKCFPSRCTRVLGTSWFLRCGSGRRGDYHAKVAILGTADGRLSPFLRMVSGPVASAPSGLLPGSCHTEVAPSGCRRIPDASWFLRIGSGRLSRCGCTQGATWCLPCRSCSPSRCRRTPGACWFLCIGSSLLVSTTPKSSRGSYH